MRNPTLLVAGAVIMIIAVAACASRDEPAADTTGDDTVKPGGVAGDSTADTTDATARDTHPTIPGAVPDRRPGRWRGFKLPETRPVRPPIESIRAIKQAQDSLTKRDSTPPPGHER